MTDSNTTGAPGAHQDIDTFAARFTPGEFPAVGETFDRSGHLYRIEACGEFEGVPLVVFVSLCQLCAKPFRAVLNWDPMGHPIARCPEHRNTPGRPIVRAESDPDAPKPKRKRRKKAKKEGPRAPTFGRFEQIVLDVVEELSMVYADIELDTLLRRAKDRIEAPPAAERDTRRQQCLRAVYSVAKKKGWDVAGGVLYVGDNA